MDLQQQVCSLELAKRLKELGVKQKSAFVWAEDLMGGEETALQFVANMPMQPPVYSWDFHAAFTVAELGEMLSPYLYDPQQNQWTLHFAKYGGEWEVWYQSFGVRASPDYVHNQYGSEADARAKMLIYLLENKLI